MLFDERNQLFNEFLAKWSKEFDEIPNIIKYISSYYKLAFKFARHSINNTSERINISQLEWVALVSQFDHPLEKEFFKSYWVPLESDSYDLFIDLSSKTFTLFEAHYFPFEPYKWYKKIWFDDISDFLASATDTTIDIESQLKINDIKSKRIVEELFDKRDELGFAGKIDNREIEKDDILGEDSESEVQSNDDSIIIIIIISGVTSMIVGLLPDGFKLKLDTFDFEKDPEYISKVNNLKSFVYLLQKTGLGAIQEYSFSIEGNKTGYVKFEDNVFTISHQNKSVLIDFIAKYENLTKQNFKILANPLYKYLCSGLCGEAEFIPTAAKELGINVKVELSGCCIETPYIDEYGIETTNAQVDALEFEEKNKDAVSFYNDSIGKDWLKKLRQRAIELFEDKEDDGLPF